jgi:hypothetical protein
VVYNPKAVIPHAALLGQGCPHCRKFLAAASRRSLGRFSVPVWLVVLTDQLPVIALVRRYHTNKLMGRRPLPPRITAFVLRPDAGLASLSRRYPPRRGRFPRVTQPCATQDRSLAYDLHALGTPPAFVLSQDQTLHWMVVTVASPQPSDPCGLTHHHDSVVKVLCATLVLPCVRYSARFAEIRCYHNRLSLSTD